MYNLFDTDRNVPVPLDPLTGYAVRKELFDSPPLFSFYSERILIDVYDRYLMEKHKENQKKIADYPVKVNKYEYNILTEQKEKDKKDESESNEIFQEENDSYPDNVEVEFDIEIRIPEDVESYLLELSAIDLYSVTQDNVVPAERHPLLAKYSPDKRYKCFPLQIEIDNYLSIARLIELEERSSPIEHTLIFRKDNENTEKLIYCRRYTPSILYKEDEIDRSYYAFLSSRTKEKPVYDSIYDSSSNSISFPSIFERAAVPYYFYPASVGFILLDPKPEAKNKKIRIATIAPIKFVRKKNEYDSNIISTPVLAELWFRRKNDSDDLYNKKVLVLNEFSKSIETRTRSGYYHYYRYIGFRVVGTKVEDPSFIKSRDQAEKLYLFYGEGTLDNEYEYNSESKFKTNPEFDKHKKLQRPVPCLRGMGEYYFDFYQTPIRSFGVNDAIVLIPKLFVKKESKNLISKIEKVPTPFSFRINVVDTLLISEVTSSNLARRKHCIVYARPNYLIVRRYGEHRRYAEQEHIYIYSPQQCLKWYMLRKTIPLPSDNDKWTYSIKAYYGKDSEELLCNVYDEKSILYYLRAPIKVYIQYYLNLHGALSVGVIEPKDLSAHYQNIKGCFIGYNYDNYLIGNDVKYVFSAFVYKNKYVFLPPLELNFLPEYIYQTSLLILKLNEVNNIGTMSLIPSIADEFDIYLYYDIIENGLPVRKGITALYDIIVDSYSKVRIIKEQKGPSGGILLLPEYGEIFYDAITKIADSLPTSCVIEDYITDYLFVSLDGNYLDAVRFYLFKVKKKINTILHYDHDSISFNFYPKEKKLKGTITRTYTLKSPGKLYYPKITETQYINDTLGLPSDSSISRFTNIELIWSKTITNVRRFVYPDNITTENDLYEYMMTTPLKAMDYCHYYYIASVAPNVFGSGGFISTLYISGPSSSGPCYYFDFGSRYEMPYLYDQAFNTVKLSVDFEVTHDGYSIKDLRVFYLKPTFWYVYTNIKIPITDYIKPSAKGMFELALRHVQHTVNMYAHPTDPSEDFGRTFLNIETERHIYDLYFPQKYSYQATQEASFQDIGHFRIIRFQ